MKNPIKEKIGQLAFFVVGRMISMLKADAWLTFCVIVWGSKFDLESQH